VATMIIGAMAIPGHFLDTPASCETKLFQSETQNRKITLESRAVKLGHNTHPATRTAGIPPRDVANKWTLGLEGLKERRTHRADSG